MSERENVVPVNIYDEVKVSFLDYAMSVIVSRALPDVRDGLKPVHRRILFAMSEMGSTHDKPHRKSARIVGEVLGKYHPHGDVAIYDTLVRLAQNFSIRYLLVDGHGNFGSQDGDSAAAMRYTEARLSGIAGAMLSDLEKETVGFRPNFDESLDEPVVLPSRFPNLLANGSSGIAVGMATNIPPHNLTELIDALNHLIKYPEASIRDLMRIVQGPDFPTGGIIVGHEGIYSAYQTGRGIIKLRGKAQIEKKDKGRCQIVITELPYQQNKAKLVEKIADLVKEQKIAGITDLRDESDRSGVRVVMEIKKDYDPQVIINQLYKFSPLQQTYGIIMLALVDGQPRVLTLKQMMAYYLEHQKEIIRRRSQYDLKKAEDRLHIVEGLLTALDMLDEVIALIRASKDVQAAREGLIGLLSITEKQAQSILDMRLQRLTQLEITKLTEEREQLLNTIKYLQRVLAEESLVLDIISEELAAIQKKYGDERRTQIVADEGEVILTDLIFQEDVVITLTNRGYIKRLPLTTYHSQHRGGRGVKGMQTRENDRVEQCHVASTHDRMLCFSNRGKVYLLHVHEIPQQSGRQSRGTALVNLLPLEEKEFITATLPIAEFETDLFLLMVTAGGVIKKTALREYRNTRKTGLIALNLAPDDELMTVKLTDGRKEVIVGTSAGLFVRFPESDVRPMGRAARGVKAVSLGDDDRVIGADLVTAESRLLIASAGGYGKRVKVSDFSVHHRGGKGMLGMKLTQQSGPLAIFVVLQGEEEEFMIITAHGVVNRQKMEQVSLLGRYARGVTLIRLDKNDRVVNLIALD
ncbi:MAG: DNA gyrase subunit A [Firmicutes bacterium ML8_F2]|jgi:DNA gyrase subunit A|nr:MAG: DNA gyrase subunit A [Firmicutes bacterium ML8_F2]